MNVYTILNPQFARNLQTPNEQRLNEELRKAQAEIQKLRERADRDSLTGCLRREAFLDLVTIRRQMGALLKNMTLVIADIDHFKTVNDTHGHGVGDAALVQFAQCLQQHAPFGTLICRMGGEEFILLIEGSLQNRMQHLENLREAVTQIRIPTLRGDLQFSASFGATDWDSSNDLMTAAANADLKLYEAKQGGRNRVAA
jgi:diguanylate cyclase (GGDEF)-like protein